MPVERATPNKVLRRFGCPKCGQGIRLESPLFKVKRHRDKTWSLADGSVICPWDCGAEFDVWRSRIVWLKK